ncbi:MAG: urease accessory protein [Verrucomicrobia bacterium 61-8]|nr:MAG: urease accessory protein [Verrucomicrobia bacterium 61-8]
MKTTFTVVPRGAVLLAAALLMPSLAHAHVGVGQTYGFDHGFTHPLSGLDQICAMIAVGLWAAQMGGRAIWAVPLTFVSVMALGGLLGMMHVPVPFIETGIVISVLTLGVLIAAAVRLPLAASILIVGLFAICHGHAHGEEMPETASGVAFAAGFILATALLHGVGIGLGIAIEKVSKPLVVRLAGAAIVLCGIYIWIS